MTHPLQFGCQFQPFKGKDLFLDTARQVEDLGFAAATFPDHFGGWTGVWPSITAAASVTSTLRLGTLTINNDLWNPIVLARDVASVDQFSEGRVELGMGAGWRTADYDITGLAYDRPGRRIARLAETIDILEKYWAAGEFEHSGEHYSAQGSEPRIRAFQDRRVPLFVGGGGDKILTLAARTADIIGVHINLNGGAFTIGTGAANQEQGVVQDVMEQRLELIRANIPEGKDPVLQIFFMEVREGASPLEAAESVAPTFGITPEQVVESPYFLVGPPEAMAEKVRSIYERYGISYFTCREDHLGIMAELLPRLLG